MWTTGFCTPVCICGFRGECCRICDDLENESMDKLEKAATIRMKERPVLGPKFVHSQGSELMLSAFRKICFLLLQNMLFLFHFKIVLNK